MKPENSVVSGRILNLKKGSEIHVYLFQVDTPEFDENLTLASGCANLPVLYPMVGIELSWKDPI